MRIRRAEDADLPAINDLTRRSSAYEGEYHAMVEGIEVTPEQLRRDHCHVAVSGDRLLGYYSLVAEPPDLDLMFVDDAARGRGVGRLLFEHMLATARGLGITAVRIVSHPPAAAFYERMGAVRVGTKPAAGRVTWDRPAGGRSCGSTPASVVGRGTSRPPAGTGSPGIRARRRSLYRAP